MFKQSTQNHSSSRASCPHARGSRCDYLDSDRKERRLHELRPGLGVYDTCRWNSRKRRMQDKCKMSTLGRSLRLLGLRLGGAFAFLPRFRPQNDECPSDLVILDDVFPYLLSLLPASGSYLHLRSHLLAPLRLGGREDGRENLHRRFEMVQRHRWQPVPEGVPHEVDIGMSVIDLLPQLRHARAFGFRQFEDSGDNIDSEGYL